MSSVMGPMAGRERAIPAAGWKHQVRAVPGAVREGSVILPFDGRDPRAAEQYRIARTKVVRHVNHPRLIAVTSPQVSDGKSITAVNLAGALALKNDASVLLVDADLRRSSLAAVLDVPCAPGLEELLKGECGIEEAVVRLEVHPGLYLLPAGSMRMNPAELFDSERWHTACTTMRREFDFVVIDTAPVGIVADYELVQAPVDAVLLVVRPDYTSRTRCMEALETISREKLLGVLMNRTPDWLLSKSRNHEYEYYRRGDD